MAKDFRMDAETGRFTLTGQDAGMVRTTIKAAISKNWLLVAVYFVINLGGIVSSYWTGQWTSVAVSLVGVRSTSRSRELFSVIPTGKAQTLSHVGTHVAECHRRPG
jgi:hypothetical protein